MPAFLISPMVRAGLLLAFILGVFGTGYLLGKRQADQTARIEELERDSRDLKRERDTARAERDETVRRAKAANDLIAEAAKREQDAQAENNELAQTIKQFEDERKAAAERPVQPAAGAPVCAPAICLPDAAAANRLREIHKRAFGTE